MEVEWNGSGKDEVGIDQHGKVRVKIDEKYLRPTEVDLLLGDSTKFRNKTGWIPEVSFNELVKCMVISDLNDEKHY